MFVICNPLRPDKHFTPVKIPCGAKQEIRAYLGRLGLSRNTLFADVPGLAQANTVKKPLGLEYLTASELQERGHRLQQRGQVAKSLAVFEKYARKRPNVAQPFALIGDALAELKRYGEAAHAYTQAIDNIDRPIDIEEGYTVRPWLGKHMLHRLYYNRGNVQAADGKHDESITDFQEALKHGDFLSRQALYNRGNSKFAQGMFNEAYEDFSNANSRREGSNTALAMGNCRVMAGKFIEAKASYLEGVNRSPEGCAAHCQENADQLEQLLQALNGQYDLSLTRNENILQVETAGKSRVFRFTGNQGNVGNTPSGMLTAPGGAGYGGLPQFTVEVGQLSQG